MMMTWLMTAAIAAGVFAVALTAMAVGVILSNRRIRGSCGGIAHLNASGVEVDCPVCGGDEPDCRDPVNRPAAEHALAEEASPQAIASSVKGEPVGVACRGEACENFGTCDGRKSRGVEKTKSVS